MSIMSGVMVDESGIRERWRIVEDALDERGRRMWAAAEARSHGRGGIAAVVRATGISEIDGPSWDRGGRGGDRGAGGSGSSRGRRGAGGLPSADPGLWSRRLLALLDRCDARGSEVAVVVDELTLGELAQKLRERGFAVHQSTVRRHAAGAGVHACRPTARPARGRSSRPRRAV